MHQSISHSAAGDSKVVNTITLCVVTTLKKMSSRRDMKYVYFQPPDVIPVSLFNKYIFIQLISYSPIGQNLKLHSHCTFPDQTIMKISPSTYYRYILDQTIMK